MTSKNLVRNTLWYVYILRCADDSLYTGITTNVQRRVTEHNDQHKGAKYTRTRQPVQLVYFEEAEDRGNALKNEAKLRKLSRKDKLALVKMYATNRHRKNFRVS